MRPTRPDRIGGVSLVELVVVIVIIGIVLAAIVYFTLPVRQAVDLSVRAELSDIADNALQRIGREVRLALPNSVRVATFAPGNQEFVEFLPIRTAGRYRGDSGSVAGGVNCPPDGVAAPAADQLSFDGVADTCFKTIGTVSDLASITTNDFIVFNNYGPNFTGQNAYATGGTLNRVKVGAVSNEGTRVRFSFAATAFDRTLHDSTGKRFFVIVGNANGLPEPVTYECNRNTGQLIRRWGYTMQETQSSPPAFAGAGAAAALIATNVSDCHFDYAANVAPQIGLLTIRLTLARNVSSGSPETISLYHAIHVSNVP